MCCKFYFGTAVYNIEYHIINCNDIGAGFFPCGAFEFERTLFGGFEFYKVHCINAIHIFAQPAAENFFAIPPDGVSGSIIRQFGGAALEILYSIAQIQQIIKVKIQFCSYFIGYSYIAFAGNFFHALYIGCMQYERTVDYQRIFIAGSKIQRAGYGKDRPFINRKCIVAAGAGKRYDTAMTFADLDFVDIVQITGAAVVERYA